jgi:hypothetical protein
MTQHIEQLIDEIGAFMSGGSDETDTVFRLYRLLDGFDQLAQREAAIEPLFRLLERNAESDLGSPGPVVHALEAVPGYEPHLVESLHRLPTYYTVWMVNRILNTELPPQERAAWLAELQRAASHSKADGAVIDSVARFLKHQAGVQD